MGSSKTMLPLPKSGFRKLNAMSTAITQPTKSLQSTIKMAGSIPKATVRSAQDTPSAPPAIEAPREPKAKPKEEIYAPGYVTDDNVRFGVMRMLNPDIDRTPALVGCNEPEKLKIKLFHPPFGSAGEPLCFTYAGEVDWNSKTKIRALNRFRETVFKHHLGLSLLCDETSQGSKGFSSKRPRIYGQTRPVPLVLVERHSPKVVAQLSDIPEKASKVWLRASQKQKCPSALPKPIGRGGS